MLIQEGKYYRRRDGQVAGPMIANRCGAPFWAAGYHFKQDGGHCYGDPDYDLVEEVTVTPVLSFPLEAGRKYVTTRPDGSEGPVVTLGHSGLKPTVHTLSYPFRVSGNSLAYVNTAGECYAMTAELLYRITAEYIEPPPPVAERLKQAIALLSNPRKDDEAFALIRGCVAELEGGGKC